MTGSSGNAPAWLFAFVDLAFLLLLGMTQLQSSSPADLGEIVVPRIGSESSDALARAAERRWQVRIFPVQAPARVPFELVDADGVATRLDAAGLRARLGELGGRDDARPLLAPHADARSEDLLQAVALIEERWPGRRRGVVRWDALR